MKELYLAVSDWPVLVQGAIGSAIFWLALTASQRLMGYLSKKLSHYSKQARVSWLRSAYLKYLVDDASLEEQTWSVTHLIYRSLRPFYKSIMWLVLGFAINMFSHPLGIIGFFGSLYYLFRAYEVISPIADNEDHQEMHQKVTAELKELKELESA